MFYQLSHLKKASTRLLKTAAFSSKPFDRVLIANRGEIVQRVIRTCNALDIETIAIHSTADSKAPFVQAATHAVCVGPPPANQSYLNVPAVLDAIHSTGAQAVHPGYGFLSENAKFAKTIQDAGIAWLGPPPSAVHSMGDKLESKKIAQQAGVNCIPGYEDAVETIEHALQLCNEVIGYPVLLKAANGGGGKGMRVCYNDQDVKDSWGVAKAEALNFFSDDRLLVEKFIERPHHIEFQVLCGKKGDELEVVVFPERECSIQRRNQKVIEETPSVLLKQETREAMAKQVETLCRAVGYESAGTVEFLVDEQQNFFFLEMNTRLQVEHPVSESITGVDLVKGMLWVGAGWGLPEEFRQHEGLIMPYKGHAMEARIYAEDPLRGYLPSTGALSPYVEPCTALNTPEKFVRVDSGVAYGHIVSPYYDPMLSKVVTYAPDRPQALASLMQALDEYVIQGVQHNGRLVQAVLREPAFQAGDTPTSFLPTHFPDGFHGVQLTPAEKEEFAVAVAAIGSLRQKMFGQPPLAGSDDTTVVVRLGGMFAPAYSVTFCEDEALVKDLSGSGDHRTIHLSEPVVYEPTRFLANVSLDKVKRSIQVISENETGEYVVSMYGAETRVLLQSTREYELSKHMHEPEEEDTTDLIMSPMPGSLISYAVKEGDEVEIGQELCIVEAMKMQNIIRSPRHGVIAKCKPAVGTSLMADEIIIEFEKTAVETAVADHA